MKKMLVAGSAVLAVVLLSGFGWRGGHGGWGKDPERVKQFITWKLDDKLEDLEASEPQKQALHAVKDRLFEEGKGMMQAQQDARAEAFQQLSSERPDAQRLHALVDARLDAMRAFAHKVTDAVLEAHTVLTPAQRKELADEYRARTGQR